jgi:glutamine synthetase
MADMTMTYRLVVKETARSKGVYATFMPKPIFGHNGSGMHTHQSLFLGEKNAFFNPGDPFHLSDYCQELYRRIDASRPGNDGHKQPMGKLIQKVGAGL